MPTGSWFASDSLFSSSGLLSKSSSQIAETVFQRHIHDKIHQDPIPQTMIETTNFTSIYEYNEIDMLNQVIHTKAAMLALSLR